MTHSEICKAVIAHVDEIAEVLRKGHDCEIRLNTKVRGVKCYGLKKYPLNGSESVQGISSGFNGADDIKHVEAEKTALQVNITC